MIIFTKTEIIICQTPIVKSIYSLFLLSKEGLTSFARISDLVRDIKAGSSGFINEKKWLQGKFNWQEGFGAFSYSQSQVDEVVKYILNQPAHHQKRTFKEEYLAFLKKFEIEYDEKYLFEWIDDVDYQIDANP